MRATSLNRTGPVARASRRSLRRPCQGLRNYKEVQLPEHKTWTRSRGPVTGNTTYCDEGPAGTSDAYGRALAEPPVLDATDSPIVVADAPAADDSIQSRGAGGATPGAAADACQMGGRVDNINSSTPTAKRFGLADGDVIDSQTEGGLDIFANSDIAALRASRIRVIVPYNLVTRAAINKQGSSPCEDFQKVKNWIALNTSRNKDILVSFEVARNRQSDVDSNGPSSVTYRKAVEEFMKMFPHVPFYTAWNEPNDSRQPYRKVSRDDSLTAAHARAAGRRWADLNTLCKQQTYDCVAIAGDFADGRSLPNLYIDNYFKGMGGKSPRIWAIHTYGAIRCGTTRCSGGNYRKRFRNFVTSSPVKGKNVWITEAGSYFSDNTDDDGDAISNEPEDHDGSGNYFGSEEQRARLQEFIESSAFQDLKDHIKRFYYFKAYGETQPQVDAGNGQTKRQYVTDDWGLLDNYPGSARRPIYCYYRGLIAPNYPCG